MLFITAIFSFTFSSCQSPNDISSIESAPLSSEADSKYADVFKNLDGTWKGKFLIFEDSKPVAANKMDLKNLTLRHVQSPRLKQVNEIEVTQVYTSESSYFQRVTITDYYPDTGKTEKSTGANKIQNGEIWCVVKKPSETIMHKGSTKGDHTIIWQSNQKSPQRIEYFQETISDQFYEIIGYGYYEGDDTKLTPKLWFYGKYERIM